MSRNIPERMNSERNVFRFEHITDGRTVIFESKHILRIVDLHTKFCAGLFRPFSTLLDHAV